MPFCVPPHLCGIEVSRKGFIFHGAASSCCPHVLVCQMDSENRCEGHRLFPVPVQNFVDISTFIAGMLDISHGISRQGMATISSAQVCVPASSHPYCFKRIICCTDTLTRPWNTSPSGGAAWFPSLSCFVVYHFDVGYITPKHPWPPIPTPFSVICWMVCIHTVLRNFTYFPGWPKAMLPASSTDHRLLAGVQIPRWRLPV